MAAKKTVLNFSPGPAKLPEDVLRQVQEELVDYGDVGISVLEMSHRSPEFMRILENAQRSLGKLLNIPENYKILFMAGGGTGQFAAVPLNLISRTGKADYVVTGTWSEKAAKEAKKYGDIRVIRPDLQEFPSVFSPRDDAAYLYYCSNETVHGVEFPSVPETNIPLVADMSSNFLTTRFDISKFALVFAGAQKNIGPAGVTLVIVREDLLGSALPTCPTVLNYSIMAADNSLHNTPPCFNLYVTGLVFQWIEKRGGLEAMERLSADKSRKIYETIDSSAGFYDCPVPRTVRSRVNIPFRITEDGKPSDRLETLFLQEAKKLNMIQLKGHRSVGGIRVSLYNAVSLDDAHTLAEFMTKFVTEHSAPERS